MVVYKRRRSANLAKIIPQEEQHNRKSPFHCNNNPPDFAFLARTYPQLLASHVKLTEKAVIEKCNDEETIANVIIDWKDPEAVRGITKALLLHYFQLNVVISSRFLCPAVPNRVNYICWLSDLVEEEGESEPGNCSLNADCSDTVIDIGVGESCIYPLLGNRLFSWRFIGTDINEEAVKCAAVNVENNNLTEKIEVLLVDDSEDFQFQIKKHFRHLFQNISEGDIDIDTDRLNEVDESKPVSHELEKSAAKVKYLKEIMIKTALNANQGIEDEADGDKETCLFRGPVRNAFIAMGSAFIEELRCAENVYLQHLLQDSSDKAEYDERKGENRKTSNFQPLLATMTNPPFYDRMEMVSRKL